MSGTEGLTESIRAWKEDQPGAADALLRDVYDDLLSVARRHLGPLRLEQTLQSGDLVSEAWLRLDGSGTGWVGNRREFFFLAAKAMRSALIDHVRAKRTTKRGGQLTRRDFEVVIECHQRDPLTSDDVLDLMAALERLAEDQPDLAQLIDLRYFGGLDIDQVCQVLDLSRSTAVRRFQLARTYLKKYLESGGDG